MSAHLTAFTVRRPALCVAFHSNGAAARRRVPHIVRVHYMFEEAQGQHWLLSVDWHLTESKMFLFCSECGRWHPFLIHEGGRAGPACRSATLRLIMVAAQADPDTPFRCFRGAARQAPA